MGKFVFLQSHYLQGYFLNAIYELFSIIIDKSHMKGIFSIPKITINKQPMSTIGRTKFLITFTAIYTIHTCENWWLLLPDCRSLTGSSKCQQSGVFRYICFCSTDLIDFSNCFYENIINSNCACNKNVIINRIDHNTLFPMSVFGRHNSDRLQSLWQAFKWPVSTHRLEIVFWHILGSAVRRAKVGEFL